MAALEEFLQEKYVENYDKFNNNESKVVQLQNIYQGYFYIPANEGAGALRYVVDSEGHALYLIKKSGLPKEIKDGLIGGDAGEGKYSDYATLNDVYGVTSDLKVYYSQSQGSELVGVSSSNLDEDNPLRIVLTENSALGKLINGTTDGTCTAQEIKRLKEISINSESGITDFSEFYNLSSLTNLTIKNINLNNLNGIENIAKLSLLRIENSIINDYSSLAGCTNLQYLYLNQITDDELAKICNAMSKTDYTKLTYFGIFGYESTKSVYSWNDDRYMATRYTLFSDISPLTNLTPVTKTAIKYMWLINNSITDISCLSGFTNITNLDIKCNRITSLNGLSGMTNLTYLRAEGNSLGDNESIENSDSSTDAISALASKTKLYMLDLRDNINLKHISYFEKNTDIRYLWLTNDIEMIESELATDAMISLIDKCVDVRIPTKYSFAITKLTSAKIDINGLTVNKDAFISKLKNNTNCLYLNIDSLKLTDNEGIEIDSNSFTSAINEVLSTMVSLKYLQASNLSKLQNINFYSSLTKLIELDIRNCPLVTDISILETQTNEGKSSLGTLIINNTGIQLTTIQNTISRLKGGCYWHYDQGLVLADDSLYSQLSNCTDITYLRLSPSWKESVGSFGNNIIVNLSKCTKLKTFYIYRVCSKFKLPSSVTSVEYSYVRNGNPSLDLSECINLKNLIFGDDNLFSVTKDAIHSLANNSTIETIKINGYLNRITDLSFCDDLATMSKLKNFSIIGSDTRTSSVTDLTNLTKLSQITNLTFSFFVKLTELPDMSTMTNLTTLTITNSALVRITESSNLDKLTELRNIDLSNNNIIDISGILNCKQITKLNLQNNCIYDIVMDAESGEKYNNLRKLAELNSKNGGSLEYLYLSGNNIIDFSPVSSLTWTGKSGF